MKTEELMCAACGEPVRGLNALCDLCQEAADRRRHDEQECKRRQKAAEERDRKHPRDYR